MPPSFSQFEFGSVYGRTRDPFEFRTEVDVLSRNMNGLPGRFAGPSNP